MKFSRKAIIAIILVVFCIILHFFSASPYQVEKLYSLGFYPFFSRILRFLFGWLPFSIGDILYIIFIIWLVIRVIKGIRVIFSKEKRKTFLNDLPAKLRRTIVAISIVYLIFNIFWGINYNRNGIAWQLGLKMEKYDAAQLKEINALLVEKINTSKQYLVEHATAYPSTKKLVTGVEEAYKNLATKYSYLQYSPVSFKSSMWGWVGNYAGFSGYYNPFTGEAQLNTTIPKFLQPYTACHETAHQLGYAKEMEANFVGYLAAANSTDTLFHYSVYLDLFNYANRNLFYMDSAAAKNYRNALSPPVVSDIKEWIEFSRRHRNPVEPIIRWGYSWYLRGNQQPQGILSYDEVTAFLIAYYKKFGKI